MSTRHNSRTTAGRRGAAAGRYTPYSLYRRALRLEPLEDRRLLAAITVNTRSDITDFNDNLTTLREAVFVANTLSGADTINFAPTLTDGPATIRLTQGEIRITDSLTINGPGTSLLTIDASGSDPTPDTNNGDGSRIFAILDIGPTINVTLSGLSITGGDKSDAGGAIYCTSNLTMNDCRVYGNSTQAPDFSGGGAVYSTRSDLTIVKSAITSNYSEISGGGVMVERGDLVVSESRISGNTAGAQGGGLRLYQSDATISDSSIDHNDVVGGVGGGISTDWDSRLTISKSTIDRNSGGFGGGIDGGGTITIDSTTISNNDAGKGAGIYQTRGGLLITNSTFSGNTSVGEGAGGAVYSFRGLTTIKFSTITNNTNGLFARSDQGATFDIFSSIVAGNLGSDVDVTIGTPNTFQSDGFNVVGTGNGLAAFNQPGDQADVTNPLLGPLTGNGGPTLTHALLPGSPALNAGDPNAIAGSGGVPKQDQRGVLFGRVFDGRIDIGAFEKQEPREEKLIVDTLADELDETYTAGDLSLREAIQLANRWQGSDTIHFAAALTTSGAAKIVLTQGELKITDSLTIDGPGAGLLTVDASGSDPTPNLFNGDGARIFNIDDGTTSVMNVSIEGLTLTGGQSRGGGGAIFTRESLVLSDAVLEKNYTASLNSSEGAGGGLGAELLNGADLTILRSRISKNLSTQHGGGVGVTVGTGSVVLISSTEIVDNSKSLLSSSETSYTGGGIFIVNHTGSATIRDSYVSGNVSDGAGGGISVYGSLDIERTVIEKNSALGLGGGISARPGNGKFTLIDSSVLNNEGATGGGISIEATSVRPTTHEIVRTRVAGNSASRGFVFNRGLGGGIYTTAPLSVVESTVDSNSARFSGGGIYQPAFVSTITLDGTTISNNTAERDGGGLYLARGADIRQSTIVNNSARSGGGVYFAANATSATVALQFSTLAQNVASSTGGGVYVARGTFNIDQTIVAKNSSPGESDDVALGTEGIVVASHSLIGDNRGSGLAEAPVGAPDANGNLIGGTVHGLIDPLLRPLADYGGPTHTLGLAPGSPAINAGNPSAVAGAGGVPLYDQRGVPFDRIIGGRIDIGAFEFRNPPGIILVVDTLVDESDGNYSIGDLSLREAIQLANLAPDENAIHFDPALTAGGPATIQLSLGELGIVGGVSVVGPGAHPLTIDASGSDPTPTVNDGLGSSIFEIGDGVDDLFDVSISGLALTGGDSQYGGAIVSTENLTITGSTITGNHAAQLGGGVAVLYGSIEITDCIISHNTTDGTGGGIAASSAEVVVEGCAIDGNVAAVGGGIHAFDTLLSVSDSSIDNNEAIGGGGAGGGIYHKLGKLTVTDSTISGNTSISGGGVYSDGDAEIIRSTLDGNYGYLHGGGIYSFGKLVVRKTTISGSGTGLDGAGIHAAGDVLVDSSTLADNDAGRHGGAIWVEVVDGALTIVNSTLSGNSADNEGGGVWITGTDAMATIAHSTIVENSSHHLFGFGGGVLLNSGSLQLDHTIIAANAAKTGADLFTQVDTNVSAQFSVIGNAQDTSLTEAPVGLPDANGNLIGGPVHGVIDPLLGPLADNGGPTFTHALLAGSPAINAGDLAAVAGVDGVPVFDQRGTPFGRVFHGRIDIGAFEYQQVSDLNLVVDTLVDENDGDYGRGDLSLREAILLANKYGGSRSQPDVTDTIRFDPALTASGPATILLTLGELQIFSLVTILGPGAELLTVDASGNDPTPNVHDGKGSRVVFISGQSVLQPISVTIAGLTLTGADRPQDGGGISSRLADLTLQDMFLFDNAAARGAGIWFATGNLRLVDTIVASNTATQSGGGVHVAMNASLSVEDSTITGNTAQQGGGVYFRDFESTGTHQLTVIGSAISVNHARASGGGVWARGIGGAMSIHDSVISGNTAGQPQLSGGGAGIYADLTNVAMSITASSLAENMANRNGGAVSLRLAGGTLVVDDSQIVLNRITGGEALGGGVHVSGQNATATIRNSLIEGNATVGNFGAGGGISANGIPLVIESSTITGNSAARAGGGVYSVGALEIRDTEISGNSAQYGAGINHRSQSLIIDRTTISGNMASRSGGGGYIGSRSAPVTITNSTIDNNSAAQMGGGLMLTPFNATIVNSTFSGNSAGQDGGAIFNRFATTNIRHSTITDNTANRGGGLQGGTFNLNHTIVAGNHATSGLGHDIAAATVTARYSLIGTNAGTTLVEAPVNSPDANGNLIGGPTHGVIDPLLGPLADNGGPTLTHALLAGSPAINRGDLNAAAGVNGVPEFDQRGVPFGRVFNGRIDIGAFEYQEPSDLNLLVDTLVDENDGNYGRGDLSLREAIALANLWPSVDTIHFDPLLVANGPAAIVLTMGELKITSSMSIVGLGAEVLTVDASGNDLTPDVNDGKGSRLFSIAGPSVAGNINVAMSGLALTGGDSSQAGGAINGLFANFSLADSTITGNAAALGGGAIYQQSGNLAVNDSIISGNTSFGLQGSGGAIYFLDTRSARFSRQLEIRDSQISNNTAGMKGGGVAARFIGRGAITIADSQISGNKVTSSNGAGGGLYLNGPTTGPAVVSVTTIIDGTSIGHNMVGPNGRGAGLFAQLTDLTITDSEVRSNTGGNTGGGIQFSNGINLTIRNSTVSDNATRLTGGGIWAQLMAGAMTLDGATIANNTTTALGDSSGGGVYGDFRNFANATITNSTLRENSAAVGGGAYLRFINGLLNVDHSQIVGNTATTGQSLGGGIYFSVQPSQPNFSVISHSVIENNASQGNDARGGGIYAAGHLKITDTKINANTSGRFGGGIFSTAGLQVLDSEITNNAAQLTKGVGGGIYQSALGDLFMADSVVSGNTATMNAGGIYVQGGLHGADLDRVTIMGNSAVLDGGGIMTQSRSLTLTDSTVASNAAGRDGGGLRLQGGFALVENSTVNNNTAAGNGGGIASFGSSLSVYNSTLSQNTATINGGGLWSNDGESIAYATFFQNRAGQAGGGAFFTAGNAGIRNSIIAHNTGPSGRDLSGLLGVTFDLHYSLIGSNQGSGLVPAPVGSPDANGNLIGGAAAIDPSLGPLGNNGGPTLTHAPRAGSPAIDAGDPAAVAGEFGVPIYDQRGVPFTRVYGGRLDMGAVELQPNPLPGDYNFDGVVDGGDYLVWRRVGTVPDFRADGNGDGVVNNADYLLWRANFGQVQLPQFASASVESAAVAVGAPPISSVLRAANRDVQPSQAVGPQVQHTLVGATAARPRLRVGQKVEAVEQAPVGLLAWLSESEAAQKAVRQMARERVVVDYLGGETHAKCDGTADALDEAFARLLS